MDLSFYKGKKVLITGHTGFKGSWMSKLLLNYGAEVAGYALEPPTNPSLYQICQLQREINSVTGDIRNMDMLQDFFKSVCPEIVIHMAAQPIVRDSYKRPVYTYDVNVMGTVNVMECARNTPSVRSIVNVTTDKVYLNREWPWGYRETEELNGYDPYSNSKSCSELVTSSYINSFFKESGTAVSTVRAGNVIGGGDFAVDRIIPDCIRAANAGQKIIVRNPYSVRPYQHVLEPITAYLMVAKEQYEDINFGSNYNVGPDEKDCLTTGALVDIFCKEWEQITGNPVSWVKKSDEGPHEASFLKLDCSKIKSVFGWKPRWDINEAIKKTVEWTSVYNENGDIEKCMNHQIDLFLKK